MTARVAASPEVTLSITAGTTTVGVAEQRILVVGQKTAAGTATSGALVTDIPNDGSWDALFGEDSMVAAMVRAGREVNVLSNMDVIPLDDDGGAVKAAGIVLFAGTATATGSITVIIGSEKNHVFTLPIAIGDTATAIGDALVAKIVADTKSPVSSINTIGSVATTAINGGTEGNEITLKISGSAAGVTVALTAMTAGATNPSLTSVFDVIGDQRYQTIVWPDGYGYSEVKTLLDGRFNATNDILDGIMVSLGTDTLANRKTALDAENSESLVVFSNKDIDTATHKGGVLVELNYVTSALFVGLRALRLTDGAPVADIVIGGGRDAIGGVHNASKPYFNTPIDPLPIPDVGLGFTAVEVASLQDSGGSVFGPNRARNVVTVEDVVTTYKTDSAGNPDVSFKFLNAVDTISAVREFQFNNLKKQYAQFRLVDAGQSLRANASETNADGIKAFMMGLYLDLIEDSLTQGGNQTQLYKDNLSVTVESLPLGKILIIQKVPVVTQLREINGTVEINFGLTVGG